DGVIPEVVEHIAMKGVRSGRRNNRHLSAHGTALGIRSEILRLNLELVDRIEGHIQSHVLTLFLVINSSRIHSVQREVVVVQAVAGKTDRPLISGPVIDGSRSKNGQGRPVAPVYRQFVNLLMFDWRTNRRARFV